MLVTCENCDAKFKLDESLIKDTGSKVRCSKCRHVFTVYKPSAGGEDLVSDQDLDGDLSEQSAESQEASLDFDLFDTGGEEESQELSLEDFGLEDEVELDEKSGISEDAVFEDEITAADLGFDDEASDEVFEEEKDDKPEEEDVAEEVSMEGLSLEETGADDDQTEAPGTEEEISFEDLSLEDAEPEQEALDGAREKSDQDLSFDEFNLEEEGPEGALSAQETPGETFDEAAQLSVPDDVPVASVEDGEESEEETQEEPPPVVPEVSTPKRKGVSTPLLVVLIVALAAGGGYLGYTLLKGGDIRIPFLESLIGANGPEMADPGNVRITLLEDAIKGEFVDNRTAGRVFMIKGKIKNDYPEMRSFIQVKGVLYNKNGKVARNETAYCGNVLSATELQTLGIEAVKRRLGNRFGDNKSNFRVSRGKVLPFMLVFFDIPQDLGEFSVEVVGSRTGSDQ